MSDLHTFALNGDAAAIVNLLKSRPNMVNSLAYGRTALHHAAHRGHVDAIRALLICKADPNVMESNNMETPLHIACTNGHTQAALLLCSRGAYGNAKDSHYEWSPLHHATERGDINTVCALLDMNTRCIDGHIAIDIRDKDGFTPLHHAAINGFPDVAIALLDRGANPHAKANNGWSVMHCACRRGLSKLCIKLIQDGVHLNDHDENDKTPLDIAHPTRIDIKELQAISINYWRQIRRKQKEESDIASGKNLYIRPPDKADNKLKHKTRKSIWADEPDISSPTRVVDMGDAALAVMAKKVCDLSPKKLTSSPKKK
jgi:ankyrin repeat protein